MILTSEPIQPQAWRSRPDLSIIYVNWNSTSYLRESIASIYDRTRDIPFEIIVVDNASPQCDVDTVAVEFKDILLIKSDKNLGFAGANNLGFKQSSGSYILFLNPDTKLVSPAINIMLGHLRSLPDAGILGCKLLNSDFSVQTSCIGKFPTILNQVTELEFLRLRWPNFRWWGIGPLFANTGKPVKVEMISGACMMVKREVYEKIGFFSEDYFMFAEDVDLCYKAARRGFANYYVGDATVVHYAGKSSETDWATVMKTKGRLRFFVKTRGRLYGWMYRGVMGVNAVGRLVLVALIAPFANALGGRGKLYPALAKWTLILKWAVGLENRALKLTSRH